MSEHTSDSHGRSALSAGRRWAAAQARRLRPAARAGRRLLREGPRTLAPAARAGSRRLAAGAASVGGKVGHELRHPSPRTRKWGIGILLFVTAVVVFLAVFDWNWLRGPISRYASARTGREVRIDGDLKVKLLTWTPEVRVGGLSIGHPRWMRTGKTAEVRNLTVRAKLVPLMMGRLELPLVDLDKPRFDLLRDAQGRSNWTLGKKSKKPAKLPPIQNFIIRNGDIRYVDQKKRLTLEGTIQSSESTVGQGRGFRLVGRGTVNSNPFQLTVTGGPLINVRRNEPYRFNADVRGAGSHISARGALPKPFDFGLINADLEVSGQDLAALYYLTGASLPNTPPYRLSGRVERDGEVFDFPRFSGRVGDSDLSGSLKADNRGDRPKITANLVSRSLDLDDLATVFGGAPATGPGETASPEQVAMARKLRASGRLLPDASLDATRLRSVDADVRFRATAVKAGRLPLRQVGFHMTLERGLLVADSISLQFPRGQIAGSARLNGRNAVPVTDIDLRMTGVGLESLMQPVRGSVPVVGALYGRAKLHGTGDSVRKAAASANGTISVVVPQGQIREAFAELMGINLVPGLFQLLGDDQDRTNLRCAVGHFDVSNGIARGTRIVVDTKPVLVTGQGQISLRDERLDLRLTGKSKKVRIGRVLAPIRVSGAFTSPQVKPELAKAAPQAGIAVALGALVSPLAAILPFVDPGLAKDANCSALTASR